MRAALDGYERGEQMSDDGVVSFCGAFTANEIFQRLKTIDEPANVARELAALPN
ncbi:MAG TPA: hypothetical protein VFP91_12100 [Vicinamibacterales bacterium]|nr:hypothetical protein [Vicinamibacterales bacterium]